MRRLKPYTQAQINDLPNKMLYAIAKPKVYGDGHDYFCGDKELAALPKYRPGRTMLKSTAIECSMGDPESDGVGIADGDDWRFIPLKDVVKKSEKTDKKGPAVTQTIDPGLGAVFALFSPFSAPAMPDAYFPIHVFPPPYKGYCEAVARSFQVDVVMPGCNVLALWSTVFQQRNYVVVVHSDWTERINLYIFLDAPPSEGKSPVLSYNNKPMNNSLERWNDENAGMIDASAAEVEILDKRVRHLKDALAKGAKTKGKSPSRDDLRNAQEELREAQEKQIFEQKWMLDDCTPEALEEILRVNGECAAVLSSESGLLGIMKGRYGNAGGGVNLDLFLKAYTVEAKHSARVGRGRIDLKNPRMTIFLMTQPRELKDFIDDEVMEGRGMCARFLYATPFSKIGSRVFEVETVPPDIRSSYEREIDAICSNVLDWKLEDTTIILSDGAKKEFAQFWNEFEKTLPDMDDPMQEWAGKLRGNVIRIAGLLHLAESKGVPGEISKATMAGAIEIGRYFIKQAEYVFSSYSESKPVRDGKYILDKLMSKGFEQYRKDLCITRKELFERLKGSSRFPTVESMHEGLQELEERGYVCLTEARTGGRGRPSVTIYLRPEVFNPS